MGIRKLPAQEERVETGPTQFGDDWPGLFIRGDNALYFAWELEKMLDRVDAKENPIAVAVLRGLVSDLRSCMV